MSDDYKKDVEVDFFNLHLAYRDQAKNYMYWAEKWANADTNRDKRRRFLRMNMRLNPDEYSLPKNPSVAATNAVIEEDEEYITLTYETHIYKAAMDAMYQVRFNIDGLVRLYLNGYFTSGPHPSTSMMKGDLAKEVGEKVHSAQHESLQKHKKRIGRRQDGNSEQTPSEDQEHWQTGPGEAPQGSSGEEG